MNAAKPNLKVSLSESMFERIPFDYEKSELTGYSNYSYWHSTFRTFFKQRSSTVLLGIMCTWYGTRTSLLLGFVIAFFDVTLGTIAGALWGYVQRIDRFMTELYNIVTNIPQTVYLVLFTYILRPSFWTIVLAMCLTGWLSIARFVRNRVVAIRENEYNIASQCLGTPLSRILLKNIVPYIVSIVIMEVALTIPYSIGSEVFLSYINLGLPLDVVSLGNLVSVGKNSFEVYPFQLIYPTIILSFVTVSFYIVGNRFADASDPRNHI